MAANVLEVENLTVGYRVGQSWRDAVREVSLRIAPGQSYGVVGESGSGKSTLALAALRFLGTGGAIRGGQVRFQGRDMAALSEHELREIWARDMRLVPQNPLAALNPSMRVGTQLVEALGSQRGGAARAQALDLLSQVRLADPARVFASYPHELSGGMQQRTLIAMALHGAPRLLILDEPTTSLDVTTEATVLDLLDELTAARGTSTLFISHNLGVVARMCSRVAVLYAGELVEDAPTATLFAAPLHPYTRGLLDSLPRPGARHDTQPLRPITGAIPRLDALPQGCVFAPRCPLVIERCRQERPPPETPVAGHTVRCHRWRDVAELNAKNLELTAESAEHAESEHNQKISASSAVQTEPLLTLEGVEKHIPLSRGLGDTLAGRPARVVRAVDGVDLTVAKGRTLGVVGESGSGKTTLARCIIGLSERSNGEICLLDVPLAPALGQRTPELLSRLQMVFQNPQEALNPYLTVGEALRRPLMRLTKLGRAEADRRVARLLDAVKLDPNYAERLPGQLSGGERQRLAIARAFAANPDLILLDESVSALDVSVQAAILNLLSELQRRDGSSYLFITHDLAVVGYLADDVAVVYLGKLMEVGPVAMVQAPPMHPYTEALLSAAPALPPAPPREHIRLEGDIPSPTAVPSGCPFHTRCPRFLGEICVTTTPPWRDAGNGHRIYCHIPLNELAAMQTARAAGEGA